MFNQVLCMSQWASRDYMKVGNVINYAALVARGR